MCANRFYIEPLREMQEAREQYALLMITGSETRLYQLDKTRETLVKKLTVDLPTNHCRGGQSQARIGRLRDIKVHDYIKKVNELVTGHLASHEIMGLVLSGNAEMKDKLLEMFKKQVKQKVLKTLVTDGIKPVHEIRPRISDIFESQAGARQKVEEFLEKVATMSGDIVYGPQYINAAIKASLVRDLIVHEDVENVDGIEDHPEINVVTTCNHDILKGYGGIVGILWYPVSMEDLM